MAGDIKFKVLPISFSGVENFNRSINQRTLRKSFKDVLMTRKLTFVENYSTATTNDVFKSRGMLISTHYPYYSIEFPLNPEEISSTKTPNWVEINRIGQQSSGLIWTGSMSEKMHFEIKLDAMIMNMDIEKELWKYKLFNEPHDFEMQENTVKLTPYLVAPPRAVFVWGQAEHGTRELDVYVTIGDIKQEYAGYKLKTIRATVQLDLTLVDIMYSTRNRDHYKRMIKKSYESGYTKDPRRYTSSLL